MEQFKLQKLLSEQNSRSQELAQQTNRLIEEIQQAMKDYLLIKHSHLMRITLATKPAQVEVALQKQINFAIAGTSSSLVALENLSRSLYTAMLERSLITGDDRNAEKLFGIEDASGCISDERCIRRYIQ